MPRRPRRPRRPSKAQTDLLAASEQVTGKVGTQLAKLVGERGLKLAGRFLAKLIPGLNLISTAFDILEVVSIIRDLVKHGLRDSAEGEGAGDKPVAPPGSKPAEPAEPTPAGPTLDEAAADRARLDARPERGRKLLKMMRTSGRAVPLDPDQLALIGALVEGLDDAALAEVAKALDGDQPAATPEDAVAAVDTAVKRVKHPSGLPTVKVNGVLRRDLAVAIADGEDAPTAPTQEGGGDAVEPAPSPDAKPPKARITAPGGGGPITTPPQEQLDLDDPMVVARHMPAEMLGRWFRVHGGNLVETSDFKAWQAALRSHPSHPPTPAGDRIREADFTIEESERGWTLALVFRFTKSGARQEIQHNFFVSEEVDDGLLFEPYTMYDLRGRHE